MTTKELINQYVTAHADNRWMDASELEALLTEFAEEMKKDAIDARVLAIGQNAIVREENEDDLRKYLLSKFNNGDKVKVIIIKE